MKHHSVTVDPSGARSVDLRKVLSSENGRAQLYATRAINLSAYVGLPYAERGCWELVRLVYREVLAIELPAYADQYARLGDAEQREIAALILATRSDWRAVPAGQERAGDAILLRLIGHPAHIGVVAQPGAFLHVFAGHTSCVESYRGPKWRPRVEGFYRHQAAP